MSSDLPAPTFHVNDLRREAQCSRVFDKIARNTVISAINAGWRESEAALALADAAEHYVLYLASPARLHSYRRIQTQSWALPVKTEMRILGGDYVLNLGHDQRNDGEGLPDARGFGNHARLHHLRLESGRSLQSGCLCRHPSARECPRGESSY